MGLFHDGHELFRKFKLSVESEITYTDGCKDMIFLYKNGIKFTPKAFLILRQTFEYDEWLGAGTIGFYSWDNVCNIQNVKGITVLEEFNRVDIAEWLAGLPSRDLKYPFLHVRTGDVAYIVEGAPMSVRSRKGKERLKEDVHSLKPLFQDFFQRPATGPVEMMIDIFSSNRERLPDVDRLSISIMDAFEGLVYTSDKQVRYLQPRVFDSVKAYEPLECRTEPMEHYEISNIPAGSLYPLATGVLDYYVVRIHTYRR